MVVEGFRAKGLRVWGLRFPKVLMFLGFVVPRVLRDLLRRS